MTGPPFAHYIKAEVDPATVERQWSAVQRKLGERRARKKDLKIGAAAFFAMLTVSVVSLRMGLFPAWIHGSKDADPTKVTESNIVELSDGSSVELESSTELKVRESKPDRAVIELRSGRARFNVVHRPIRKFQVIAGRVRIQVTGTKFVVERTTSGSNDHISVSVTQGMVEIHSDDEEPRSVGAGERWSSVENSNSSPAETTDTISSSQLTEEPEKAISTAEADSAKPLRPHREDSRDDDDAALDELWEKAKGARRENRHAVAAAAFEEIIRRFPKDPLSPLAAFELGRICMDSIEDLECSKRALRQAINLGLRSDFREDALARLIKVYKARGEPESQARACREYLTRYPNGLHSRSILSICNEL